MFLAAWRAKIHYLSNDFLPCAAIFVLSSFYASGRSVGNCVLRYLGIPTKRVKNQVVLRSVPAFLDLGSACKNPQ